MIEPKRIFHDMFANGGDGVPHHVVVQYFEDGSDFMCAEYFANYDDANKFIEELNNEN